MRLRLSILLVLFVFFSTVFFVLRYKKPDDNRLDNGASIKWVNCWFSTPLFIKTDCAYFSPSKEKSISQDIRIPVVIIRHNLFYKQRSPLMYINGGPGSATGLDKNNIKNWYRWVKKHSWDQDLILFDQRGTGLSTPKYECLNFTKFQKNIYINNFSMKEQERLFHKENIDCLSYLKKINANPKLYSNKSNVNDVIELIQIIGIKKAKLYGVSYGTRVTLGVIQRAPEYVESVVLDSVNPPNSDLFVINPEIVKNTFGRVFNECKEDMQCDKLYPNLKEKLFSTLNRLSNSPVSIAVKEPQSNKAFNIILDDYKYFWILFYVFNNADLIGYLPAIIHSVEKNNYELFGLITDEYMDYVLDRSFNDVVFGAVECNQSRKMTVYKTHRKMLKKYPLYLKYIDSFRRLDPCKHWVLGETKDQQVLPKNLATPALILSGAYDPTTPKEWARKSRKYFVSPTYLEFKYVGHGVVDSSACASKIAKNFLGDHTKNVKHECFSNQKKINFTSR